MSSKRYFISRTPNRTEGPFQISELERLDLPPQTQVFTYEINEWRAISRFPELAHLVGEPDSSAMGWEGEKLPNRDTEENDEKQVAFASQLIPQVVSGGEVIEDLEQPLRIPFDENWTSKDWIELCRRKRDAKVALGVCMAAAAASALSSFYAIDVLKRINSGDFVSEDDMMRTAEVSDALLSVTGVGYVIAFLVSAVFFVRWFQFMHQHLCERVDVPWSCSAGASSWFIPVLNVFRPFQIANKMIEASANQANGKAMIWIWWAAWIIGLIIDRAGPDLGEILNEDSSVPKIIYHLEWTMVSMIFTVFSGWTALLAVDTLVRAASTWPVHLKSD